MPTYPSSTSNTLKFTSSFSADTTYNSEGVNNIILSDESSVYTVFKSSVIDTFSITESITAINSQYIKRVIDYGINISDESYITVISAESDPNISDINISDETTSATTYQGSKVDNISLIDDPKGYVKYDSESSNNISITDNVSLLISKNLTALFKNAIAVAVGISEVTLYTCSTPSATIVNICLANKHTDTIIVDVILYESGTTARYIIKDIEIGLHQSFVINNSEYNTIALMKTDEIRIVSNVASSLDVYSAVVEI